jgi:indole-3-acetate monooxygenase
MADDGARRSSGSEYVARARRIAPLIATAADGTEEQRRLPDDVRQALHEAGLFRMLLPISLGGAELDPAYYVQTIEVIAAADASTAWCVNQANGCSMSAAYLEPDVAREIFGAPNAVMSWGPGMGRAVIVDGGYRVSGTWNFASGGRHATSMGARCQLFAADGTPQKKADGTPAGRTMILPASAATWEDVWDTIGLRGTGSDRYSFKDVLIPANHSFGPDYGTVPDGESKRTLTDRLHAFPAQSLFAPGFAGVALGIARGLLDAFVDMAKGKVSRGAVTPLREDPVAQLQFGRADVRLRAARSFLLESLREVWAAADPAQDLSLEHRFAIRMPATNAILEARDVVDAVYHAAGASVVFESQPFTRRVRDMHSVAQHLQGRLQHFQTIGQHLLGLEVDDHFV